ncbi:MAG: right-handed parallel beta-helix repeat-containing protein, partial [Pseudomonadota bacterium]
GNVLDTGNGVSVQAIWLGNTEFTGGNTSHVYQDITVSNNLIYSGSANGIGVIGANDVLIEDNTLLWNEDAVTIKANGDTSFEPRIRLEGVTNGEVNNNITPRILSDADDTLQGNIIISYDEGDANYVGDHFVNAADGGDIGFEGWQLVEGSPWVGTGASVSQPGGSASAPTGGSQPQDPVVVVEDPQEPEEPNDPVEQEEEPQEPVGGSGPSTPAPEIDGETLFAVDFENGYADQSGYDTTFRAASDNHIVATPDGSGYEIGRGQVLRLDVDNEQIHNLSSFGFEMEITLLDSDDVGRFLHFPRTFEAWAEKDGTVTFSLTTDEGTFKVNSGQTLLADGETHMFAVGYDDAAGKLSMSIDGTVVGSTDASGTTGDGVHHGLTVGSIWGNSVDAIVDDVFLSTDPMEAGVDLSLEVGEDFDPPIGQPIGGPVEGPGTGEEDPAEEPGGETGGETGEEPTAGAGFFETLFAADFEEGVVDISAYDSDFKNGDADDIVATEDGNAYQIGEGDFIRLERGNEQIHELESFGLSLDIQLLDDDTTGRFLHFPRVLEAIVEDDRSITFRLDTDEGSFSLNSGATNFDDLEAHRFSIGYDSEAEQLTMAIDGDVVDSVAASGQTGEMVFHGLAVGSIWGDSAEALVDNVWLGAPSETSEASVDAGLFHALISSAVDAGPDFGESNDGDIDEEDFPSVAA